MDHNSIFTLGSPAWTQGPWESLILCDPDLTCSPNIDMGRARERLCCEEASYSLFIKFPLSVKGLWSLSSRLLQLDIHGW